MDQDGHSEGGRNGPDSGDALKVDPTGLADGLEVWCGKKKTWLTPEVLIYSVKGMVFLDWDG